MAKKECDVCGEWFEWEMPSDVCPCQKTPEPEPIHEKGFDQKLIDEITEAKRLWKSSKKQIIYTDALTNEEAKQLIEDKELIRLVRLSKQTQQDIIKRVEYLVGDYRGDQAALEKHMDDGK